MRQAILKLAVSQEERFEHLKHITCPVEVIGPTSTVNRSSSENELFMEKVAGPQGQHIITVLVEFIHRNPHNSTEKKWQKAYPKVQWKGIKKQHFFQGHLILFIRVSHEAIKQDHETKYGK